MWLSLPFSRPSHFAALLLLGLVSWGCISLNQHGWVAASPLMLAILLGIIIGHSGYQRVEDKFAITVQWAKGPLLRLAIALYGFRLSLEQIQQVGINGVLLAALVLSLTIGTALWMGKRLGLDRQTSLLVGAGSAICGAAAVLACQSQLKASDEKVSVAIGCVVLFGSLAMLFYPLTYTFLSLTDHQLGLLIGATVHEVAQVAAASGAISEPVQQVAVIEKMLRVMLLAPFLLWLSWSQKADKNAPGSRLHIPWFALGFLLCSLISSMDWLSNESLATIRFADELILTMAMLALGLNTRIADVLKAGRRPLVMAAALFVLLIGGGLTLTLALT